MTCSRPWSFRLSAADRAAPRWLAGTVLALALGACATEPAPYVERPVEELYNEAADLMAAGDYLAAANAFDEVERQHPYSVWATRAQLMAAYAYYQHGSYDEAVAAAERYLQLHPGGAGIAYAHYLAAISFYEQIVDVGRDQAMSEAALQNLQQVVLRYPDTEYARDARLKIDLVNEHLAGKEMEIGRFYLRRGQYAGAIRRFRTVVARYETTSHTPEALHRLTEAYLAIGVVEEARATVAVLGHNFPGSDWYRDSYQLLALDGAGDGVALVEEAAAPPRLSWWQRLMEMFRGG